MENQIVLSASDRAAMNAAWAEVQAEQNVQAARCQMVLDQVQALVSKAVYQEILGELADSQTFDYKITTSPVGSEQDDGASWGSTFVNQTINGGYSGDDYAGTLSIPLVKVSSSSLATRCKEMNT